MGWRDRGLQPSANSALCGLLPFVGAMSGNFHPRATGTSSAWRFYLLPALLAITACSHVPVAVCPAIVLYTQGEQNQAADELDALPPDAVLRTFMDDYKTERARLRACQ